MFCPSAGIRNSEGASFCVRCGASLLADQPESATTLSYVARRGGPRDRRRSPACVGRAPASSSAAAAAGRARPTRSAAERITIGRHPDSDDLPRRRHRVAQPRRRHARRRRLRDRRRGQPQRHLRQPAAHRAQTLLSDGDELQIGKYKLTFIAPAGPDERREATCPRPRNCCSTSATRSCSPSARSSIACAGEFPDISVSKLRYLEEQGLVTPRRTKSGYRLYSQDDFQRLVRVLSHAARRVPAAQGHPPRARAQPGEPRCRTARQGLRKTDFVPSPGERAGVHRRRAPRSSPAPTPPCSTSSRTTSSSTVARSAACGATPRPTPASWPAAAQLARSWPAAQEPARHQERRRSRERAHRAGAAAGAALASRPSSAGGPGRSSTTSSRPSSQLRQLLLARGVRRLTGRTRAERPSRRAPAAFAQEDTVQDATPVDLAAHVRDIPDFPKDGILFRDIMPLLQDAAGAARRRRPPRRVRRSAARRRRAWAPRRAASSSAPPWPTASAPASSARASPASCRTTTVSRAYDLEYGTDTLEVHDDAIKPGMNVLVHDDLLATGGTASGQGATGREAGRQGRRRAFLIELADLDGREKLPRLRRLQPDHVLRRGRRSHAGPERRRDSCDGRTRVRPSRERPRAWRRRRPSCATARSRLRSALSRSHARTDRLRQRRWLAAADESAGGRRRQARRAGRAQRDTTARTSTL